MTKRAKIIYLPEESLLKYLQGQEIIIKGIPENAKFIQANYSFEYGGIGVLVESPDYEMILPGERFPIEHNIAVYHRSPRFNGHLLNQTESKDIPCKWIDGKDLAVLTEDYQIEGFTIPRGFVWNGASIPNWLFTPLFISPFHHTVRRASLIHDYLYYILHDRKAADKMFLKICREDGANEVQCLAMYAGLRAFGWKAYNDGKKG